jgi:hypothetical protein
MTVTRLLPREEVFFDDHAHLQAAHVTKTRRDRLSTRRALSLEIPLRASLQWLDSDEITVFNPLANAGQNKLFAVCSNS